jgi:hypothetical protein
MRRNSLRCVLALLSCGLSAVAWSGQKWNSADLSKLTEAGAQQLLNDSPWSVTAGAVIVTPKLQPGDREIPLPKPANEPAAGPSYASDGYGVDDGQWDGGVGKIRRGEPPKIPALVRWDSALPVRVALLKAHDPAAHDSARSLAQPEKDYIIEVIGLIPARKAHPTDQDDDNGGGASSAPSFDLNDLRNGVASSTRLLRRGKPAIAPEDVHLDEATGALTIFFPKTNPIVLDDKEVEFRTSFGTLLVVARFRLKDLLYQGRLEL